MPRASNPLVEASLDLAWSHWVGLGVRGTAQPPSTAVDPESLLYFTACLAEHDPRLRDEAGDWWRRYKQHVTRARLTALATRFEPPTVAKLERLVASFAAVARTSGKSRLDHLGTPARSLLRLRCVFGANARAEIVLELLTRRAEIDGGLTALALSEVGYSKRNIAFVLDDLVFGGILTTAREGNRVRYRVADPDGLERVLSPLPRAPGRWHVRLPVLAAFIELADRLRGRDATVQGIEARKTLDRLMPQILAIAPRRPLPTAIVETYWPSLQRWLVDNLIAEAADAEHRIAGMIEGAWVGPDQAPRRPDRFTSAVLPRITADPVEDAELRCLDLVQVATVDPPNDWAWAVLSTAATSTYEHTIGLNDRRRWRFATWALGEPRVYAVEYDAPLPHARLARLYGKAAAAHARTDRPAVQLRLRRVEEAR